MKKSPFLELRKKVGTALRDHRKEKVLTMDSMGQRLGVAKSTIHNIEHGIVDCHFGLVVAYAKTLGPDAVTDLQSAISGFEMKPARAR